MNIVRNEKVPSFLITYIPAVISMLLIYIAAMYIHMLHIDFKLLGYVVIRVLGVAVVVGLMGMLIPARFIKWKIFAGIILGSIAGAVFIRLFY